MPLKVRCHHIQHGVEGKTSNLRCNDPLLFLSRLKHKEKEIEHLVVKELIYSVFAFLEVVSGYAVHIFHTEQLISLKWRIEVLDKLHQTLFISKKGLSILFSCRYEASCGPCVSFGRRRHIIREDLNVALNRL